MDQELQRIQRVYDVTHTRQASGQPAGGRQSRHGRHLESLTSHKKSDSVSPCALIWRTILPNFIPIRSKTTKPWAFWRGNFPQQELHNKFTTIWDQLISWCKNKIYRNYWKTFDTDVAPCNGGPGQNGGGAKIGAVTEKNGGNKGSLGISQLLGASITHVR